MDCCQTMQNFGSWRTDFLSNLRLLELKFDKMLGFRTELFPNFEALKCEFSKNLWFQVNAESWGTENSEMGVLENGQEGVKRGLKGSTYPYPIFNSSEYPLGKSVLFREHKKPANTACKRIFYKLHILRYQSPNCLPVTCNLQPKMLKTTHLWNISQPTCSYWSVWSNNSSNFSDILFNWNPSWTPPYARKAWLHIYSSCQN